MNNDIKLPIYMDYASTTPVDPRVAKKISDHLTLDGNFGNPASRTYRYGWVAEEALAISVYCALVSETFEQAIVLAVNHDGDSDSTGAITGNILGAMLGTNAIPERWLQPLELREVIEALASDLWSCQAWHSLMDDERLWDRYPGH